MQMNIDELQGAKRSLEHQVAAKVLKLQIAFPSMEVQKCHNSDLVR